MKHRLEHINQNSLIFAEFQRFQNVLKWASDSAKVGVCEKFINCQKVIFLTGYLATSCQEADKTLVVAGLFKNPWKLNNLGGFNISMFYTQYMGKNSI